MVILVLLALQTIFALKFLSVHKLAWDSPVLIGDNAVHHLQLMRVREFLKQDHRLWGYDPSFMAGFPTAAFYLVDSVGAIFTISFFSLFMPTVVAAKLLTMMAPAFLPVIIYFACRNLLLKDEVCSFAGFMTIFVSNIFLSYRTRVGSGGYSFLLSTFLGLLCFSLMYRYLEKGGKLIYAGYIIIGAYAFSLHILFPFVFLPFLVFYFLFDSKKLVTARARQLLLGGLFIIVVNLVWVWPILQSLKYYNPVNLFVQALTTEQLLEQLHTPSWWLIYFLLLCALFTPFFFRHDKKRALCYSLWCVFYLCFVVSSFRLGFLDQYLGNLEPRRFIFLSVLLIPVLFSVVFSVKLSRHMGVIKTILFSLLLTQILFLQSMYPGNGKYDYEKAQQILFPPMLAQKLERLNPLELKDIAWLIRLLKAKTNNSGRILIENNPRLFHRFNLTAALPHYTKRQFIGGPFICPKIIHHFASFNKMRLFAKDLKAIETKQLMDYMDLYNIKWVVVSSRMAKKYFRNNQEYFRLLAKNKIFQVFVVKRKPSFFVKGEGKIRADLSKITINKASKGEIIIKYHYFDRFKSSPPVEIERVMLMDDPVGFIKINNSKGYNRIKLYF
jgi:hypothetical protein